MQKVLDNARKADAERTGVLAVDARNALAKELHELLRWPMRRKNCGNKTRRWPIWQASDLTEILVLVLRQLNHRLADFAAGNLSMGLACTQWCALRGKTASLKIGRRRVAGVCQGIDDNGALIVGSDRARYVTGVAEHIDWSC